MRFVLFWISFVVFLNFTFAGEQLELYKTDKANGWDLYVEGTRHSLAGEILPAIEKWKQSAQKNNLHAIARLYQDDLLEGKTEFSEIYGPYLDSKFGILQYLKLRTMEYSDATEALKKTIVESMLELEGTDDYWALSIVGNYYTDLLANRQLFQKGMVFLVKAAEGGYSPAQDKLGVLYWQGNEFFNKDLKKAKDWLEKAASTKDKFACLHLAQIYHNGTGNGSTDIPKSIPFYEEAARQGVNDANLNLALIYEEGQSVAKDPEKAHKYLSALLDCGDVEIYRFLGARYFHTLEEWKDKEKGLLWYELAAEYGDIKDKYKYADFYFSDETVRDYPKALKLFLSIAPKDGQVSHSFHILIYLRLGAMYMQGLGVKQDYLEAKKYYEKINTTSEALEAIIAMYLNGWGVQQSDEMVIFYINKLMDPTRAKGYDPGPYFEILANIYQKRQNEKEQILNLRLAALCGRESAFQELRKLYAEDDAEKLGDLGDIQLALMKYDEAVKYYRHKNAKNNLRNRYQYIRVMNIKKSKLYNEQKSLDEMKKLAKEDFSNYTESLSHEITDRVIDPELTDVPLRARLHFWLGVQYKNKINFSKKKGQSKLQEEAIVHFLNAEKVGYRFGKLSAAALLLKSEDSQDWPRAQVLLESLLKDKDPFAAAFMSALYTLPKYNNVDAKKALEFKTQAYAWDHEDLWGGMSVDTLMKKGIYQLVLNPIQTQEK